MGKDGKPNIIEFFEEPLSPELHIILRGTLYIEAVLSEVLERSLPNPDGIEHLNSLHPKTKLTYSLGRIDKPLHDTLLKFNKIRNEFAHKINFSLGFEEVFNLVEFAASGGIDFSDEGIFTDMEYSRNTYGAEGVLLEVVSNSYMEIIHRNEDLFTMAEIGDLCG